MNLAIVTNDCFECGYALDGPRCPKCNPDVTVDRLWDALRKVACVTKPYTDAKVIVQLRRDDVAAALKSLD